MFNQENNPVFKYKNGILNESHNSQDSKPTKRFVGSSVSIEF